MPWIKGISWICPGLLALSLAGPLTACASASPAPPPPSRLAPAPVDEAPPALTAEPAPPAPSVTAVAIALPPASATPPFAAGYAIDELRLIALIVGTRRPLAMFTDPTGLGFVVSAGDLVGRPEELRPGDPSSAAVWKVGQIRPHDLVLLRDDPAHPGVPQQRIVPLAKPKTP